MTYYNDEDRKLYEDGVELVAKMNENYREGVEKDDDFYISDAVDGWASFKWDKAAVLRATGLIDKAYELVLEEVEEAVRDNLIIR